MTGSTLILIAVAALILIFLPQILKGVQGVIDTRTDEEKKEDKLREDEQQTRREDEGAVKTGARIIFGDEVIEDLDLFLTGGKTREDKIIEKLNESATEALGRQVTFSEETIINHDGTISGQSTFELNETDIQDIIHFKNQAQKDKEKPIQFEQPTKIIDTSRRRIR